MGTDLRVEVFKRNEDTEADLAGLVAGEPLLDADDGGERGAIDPIGCLSRPLITDFQGEQPRRPGRRRGDEPFDRFTVLLSPRLVSKGPCVELLEGDLTRKARKLADMNFTKFVATDATDFLEVFEIQ